MQLKLKILAGKHAGREIEIHGPKFLIGRGEECHLRPGSEAVSRRHCVLLVGERRVHVQDLQSANGTFVNDQRIEGARGLHSGDRLRVGSLVFEVLLTGVADSALKTSSTTIVTKSQLAARSSASPAGDPASADPALADTALADTADLGSPPQLKKSAQPRSPDGPSSSKTPEADVLQWLAEPPHPHLPRAAWTQDPPAGGAADAGAIGADPTQDWPILGDSPGFGVGPGSPSETPASPPAADKSDSAESSGNAAAAFIEAFRRRPKGH